MRHCARRFNCDRDEHRCNQNAEKITDDSPPNTPADRHATTPQTPVACCIFHIIKLLVRAHNCFCRRTLATFAAPPASCNIILHVAPNPQKNESAAGTTHDRFCSSIIRIDLLPRQMPRGGVNARNPNSSADGPLNKGILLSLIQSRFRFSPPPSFQRLMFKSY
jgi:hypothetical protein